MENTMRNIKEAEAETGISKQNIRYYERQGLLSPRRDGLNGYRKYADADIERLKIIYLFRKLNMPLEEIHRLFNGEVELQDSLREQKARLEQEQKRLAAALSFCDTIQEQQLQELNVNEYLEKLKDAETQGNVFASFMRDYKEVVKSEAIREFSFSPEDWCTTPQQMTEQLCQYANENHLNLVITKESMCPEFTIDGREYSAYRTTGRYGMTLHAKLVHPEDYMPKNMSLGKYRFMRAISVVLLPLLIFLVLNLPAFIQLRPVNSLEVIGYILLCVFLLAEIIYSYFAYGKNFRG